MSDGRTRRGVAVGIVAMVVATISGPLAAADGNGFDRVSHADQTLASAGSARVTARVSVSGVAKTPTVTKITGVIDFTHRNVRFTLDTSALGARGITCLIVGGVVYVSVDFLKSLTRGKSLNVPTGTRWLKLDPGTPGAAGSGSLSPGDPTANLDFLRGVTGNVQDLGSATVGGAKTTHYEFTMDLTQAVQRAPASQRAQVQQAVNAIGGAKTIPAAMWIDAQGRMRRFSTTIDERQGSGTAHIAETVEYSSFGTPVSVSAPPASQVFDFSQFLGPLGSALGGPTV
jgi:hypothetical protein